jgi:Tfp pilus assembly protein PilF
LPLIFALSGSELEPDNANINSNYAVFLNDIHKNYDQAEKHYKKALKLEPVKKIA